MVHVGLVLEMSRLARAGRVSHQLIEVLTGRSTAGRRGRV
jgi:hypothetical protein